MNFPNQGFPGFPGFNPGAPQAPAQAPQAPAQAPNQAPAQFGGQPGSPGAAPAYPAQPAFQAPQGTPGFQPPQGYPSPFGGAPQGFGGPAPSPFGAYASEFDDADPEGSRNKLGHGFHVNRVTGFRIKNGYHGISFILEFDVLAGPSGPGFHAALTWQPFKEQKPEMRKRDMGKMKAGLAPAFGFEPTGEQVKLALSLQRLEQAAASGELVGKTFCSSGRWYFSKRSSKWVVVTDTLLYKQGDEAKAQASVAQPPPSGQGAPAPAAAQAFQQNFPSFFQPPAQATAAPQAFGQGYAPPAPNAGFQGHQVFGAPQGFQAPAPAAPPQQPAAPAAPAQDPRIPPGWVAHPQAPGWMCEIANPTNYRQIGQ